jgi:hypothetical protein
VAKYYCSWCGAELEPGAHYCNECGARAPEIITVDGSRDAIDRMRGIDIVGGESIPASDTQRMDKGAISDRVVVSGGRATRYSSESGIPKSRKHIVIGVAAAACLVVALVGFYFIWADKNVDLPASGNSLDGTETTQVEAIAPTENVADAPAAPSDSEVYTQLVSYYENLGIYKNRLFTCLDEFNNGFVDPSQAVREGYYANALSLLEDLQNDLDNLNAMELADDSVYVEDLENQKLLYEYMIGRIQPLVDAWALSVSYDDPTTHSEEILAELSKDYVNGENPNIALYDNLYWQAKPKQK